MFLEVVESDIFIKNFLFFLGNAGMVIIIIDGTLMDVVCTYLIQQFLLKLDKFPLMKKTIDK